MRDVMASLHEELVKLRQTIFHQMYPGVHPPESLSREPDPFDAYEGFSNLPFLAPPHGANDDKGTRHREDEPASERGDTRARGAEGGAIAGGEGPTPVGVEATNQKGSTGSELRPTPEEPPPSRAPIPIPEGGSDTCRTESDSAIVMDGRIRILVILVVIGLAIFVGWRVLVG